MLDDERWRDELLRELRLLEAVPHDGLDARCTRCGSFPRVAGELMRRSEARLAEAHR